jgi:hypothetical protein
MCTSLGADSEGGDVLQRGLLGSKRQATLQLQSQRSPALAAGSRGRQQHPSSITGIIIQHRYRVGAGRTAREGKGKEPSHSSQVTADCCFWALNEDVFKLLGELSLILKP